MRFLTGPLFLPVDVPIITTRTSLSCPLYTQDARAKGPCTGALLWSMTYTTSSAFKLKLSFVHLVLAWRLDTYSFLKRFQKLNKTVWTLVHRFKSDILEDFSDGYHDNFDPLMKCAGVKMTSSFRT